VTWLVVVAGDRNLVGDYFSRISAGKHRAIGIALVSQPNPAARFTSMFLEPHGTG